MRRIALCTAVSLLATNVAEAIVRTYHRYGDYEHRQRNRMKFLIKTMGWDAFKAHVDETLAEIRRNGGKPLRLSEAQKAAEQAPEP